MLKLFATVLLLISFSAPIFAQNVEELVQRIDAKLRRDKRYLNLNYMDYQPTKADPVLQGIPRVNGREPVSLLSNENITYKIVFLKDAIGIDSAMVLYIDEVTNRAGIDTARIFGDVAGATIDTTRILTYSDIFAIQTERPEIYNELFTLVSRYVRENQDNALPTLLKIAPDADIKTSLGLSSRDNTDFLNYNRANSPHWYPKKKVEKKSIRGKKEAATEVAPAYKIDASFSQITFSHDVMNFSIGGAALEVNFQEKVLNTVPWRNQAVNVGFRTLISLSEKKDDIDKAVMVDAKIMGRIAFDASGFSENLPWIAAGAAKLNSSNAAGLDVSITKAFGLPFINVFVAAGSPSYTAPPLKVGDPKGNYFAYFNGSSAEFTMSFFWNASDNMVARFKLDVGAGYYDIYEGTYINGDRRPSVRRSVQAAFFPVVGFHFNFAPEDKDLYGAYLKFFDSQAKVNAWLKILELEGGHSFRFDGTYITPPIARKQRAWENKGGGIVNIRYRYGL